MPDQNQPGQAPGTTVVVAPQPDAPTPPAPTVPLESDADDRGSPDEWDKDRAKATILRLREFEKTAKAQTRELEDLRKAQKDADDAKLSEQERLTKRTTELETALAQRTQHYQSRLDDADIRLAASALEFTDPGDAPRLLDLAALDRDEDGVLKGVNAALKKLVEAKPYLLKTGQGQRNGASVPGTPRPAGPPSTAEQLQHTKDQLRATGLYST